MGTGRNTGVSESIDVENKRLYRIKKSLSKKSKTEMEKYNISNYIQANRTNEETLDFSVQTNEDQTMNTSNNLVCMKNILYLIILNINDIKINLFFI